MPALDELIGELQAEGTVDSEGRFTLDREQARAKMQKFQLADARRYVLELVQAAVLRGATQIHFAIDADDMAMRFDGQPFTAAELDDLYGSLFGEGDSPAIRGVRQLALALNAAMGMEPRFIHLRSGAVEMRMRPGQPDAIETHDAAQPGTTLHVRQRVRPKLILDFFKNLVGRLAEEQYLRERCAYAQLEIVLEGKRLSRGHEIDAQVGPELRFEGEDFSGVMRVYPDNGDYAELRLVKDGVWIDSRRVPKLGTHLVVVAEGQNLRKDVSQARIVGDQALERIIAGAARVRWQLWALALDGAQENRRGEMSQRIRIQLLDYAARVELEVVEHARTLAEGLRWTDARIPGREYSLRSLVDAVPAGATLRWAPRSYELEAEAEAEPILVLTEDESTRLARVLELELRSAGDELAIAELRERSRKQWRERAGEPVLPTHINYAARGEFSGPGAWGEVGLDGQAMFVTEREHPAQVLLYLEGCLLGRLELELDLPNLWLAIEAPFTPSNDYRDAERDETFVDALLAGLLALEQPFAQMLDELRGHVSEAVARGQVKRWLIAMLHDDARRELIHRCSAPCEDPEALRPAALVTGLRSGSSPLADASLFRSLAGEQVSIATLVGWREHDDAGRLAYLSHRPEDSRVRGDRVVILGPGDRDLVRALFGRDCLEPFDTEPQLRRLRFLEQEPTSVAALAELDRNKLAEQGVHAGTWQCELEGRGEGYLSVAYAEREPGERSPDPDELALVRLRILHEQRPLCELELDLGLGFGPLVAVVEHPKLQPNERYDGVLRDAVWQELVGQLRAAADRLYAQLISTFTSQNEAVQRWLAPALVHASVATRPKRNAARRAAALAELRLLPTVRGGAISLAEARTIIAEHGELEYVDAEASWAELRDPDIVKLDESIREDLAQLLGAKRLVDGSDRLRHHMVYDKLASCPPLREAALDEDRVWVALEFRDNARSGAVGLSRGRLEPGLHLRIGVAGYCVHEAELDGLSHLHLPLEAVVLDDDMPLDAEGQVRRSKRYKGLLRLLRRRSPALIQALCEGWDERSEDWRRGAWPLVVAHLRAEAGQERRRERDQAFDSAAKISGFVDVFGERHSLRELMPHGRRPRPAVLERLRPKPPALELGRPVLCVSPGELACLEANLEVERWDDRWERELARLERLAQAPKLEQPALSEVALVERKAQVAGGLECQLWVPRGYDALAPRAQPPQIAFARGDRELGRLLLASTPCAGVVRGEVGISATGEPELDARQHASLLRQVLIMYIELAQALANERLTFADRAEALAYLAWFELCVDQGVEDFSGVGKRVATLHGMAREQVPPGLREALRRSLERRSEAVLDAPELEAAEPEVAEPEPEPGAGVLRESDEPGPEPAARSEAPAESAPAPIDPHQLLLSALWDQLQWARQRHAEVLDELSLARLSLTPLEHGDVVELQLRGIHVNTNHPLVERLVQQGTGGGHDPFDLALLVAAIYTLMNHHAEAITDDDEREFVAQLAEATVLSVRALRREPGSNSTPP